MKLRPYKSRNSLLLGTIALLCTVSLRAASAQGTIVILGSSTAAGVGASSIQTSWVGLLSAAVSSKGYTVKNVSISGTNTTDSLARFDHDVTPYNPGFVILTTSIINEPAANPVQSYLQNTLLLIRRVESVGAIPILVPPYPNNGFSAAMYSSIKGIYTTLAAEGVPILDFLDGTDDGQGHWVAGLSLDGTHPTDVGHRLLFDCIPLTLFDALRQPMPPVNPRGFGSWVQNTDALTQGDLEIQPSSAMGSWTISFWTMPSAAATERTLLTVNSGLIQLRRAGIAWELWRAGTRLAAVDVYGGPAFRHVALTYQCITGNLALYIDARLRAQTVATGVDPVAVLSVGGDPGNAGWNATGDGFADIVLYRAPLAQPDIQAIRIGHTPWKSVEAWLPMAYSPSRPSQNLAASVVTIVVHGSWAWSAQDTSPVPPSVPGWFGIRFGGLNEW